MTEADAISSALSFLKAENPSSPYAICGPQKYPASKQKCDLVIPDEWAIEFKLIRPFGDNGVEAEHWSENVLHPYPGNTSSIGDCLKLLESGFAERKAIVIFGYEPDPAVISLDPAIASFETLAHAVAGVFLSDRHETRIRELIHPVHQACRILGWEILLTSQGATSKNKP